MQLTVKQARTLREKTQKEMAKEMGISRDTYRKIEDNPDSATIWQAKMFCRITGFAIDQIFFFNNSTESGVVVQGMETNPIKAG